MAVERTIDLEEVLRVLSEERPVFHSEADFQYALAWKIHQTYPDDSIRLEKPTLSNSEEIHVDIVVIDGDSAVPIEIKYKTREARIVSRGEEYRLKNQSAEDQGRYDFLKDISRIERIPGLRYGFALFLTNDESYWGLPKEVRDTVDWAFRIHEGRNVAGRLAWGEGASAGTTAGGRDKPIEIMNEHILSWKDYSNLSFPRGRFRYLLVMVGASKTS